LSTSEYEWKLMDRKKKQLMEKVRMFQELILLKKSH